MGVSTWEIAERQEGSGKDARVSHDVVRNHRTVASGLNEDGAKDLVKRTRRTDEQVTLVEVDGYRTDITKHFEPRGWRRPARRR